MRARGSSVTPDVLVRKLVFIRRLLEDLSAFRGADATEVTRQHYTIERIMEVLASAAGDTVRHLLSARGVVPDSYHDAFRLAVEQDLLPSELAARLQRAMRMRDVLVRGQVSTEVLHQGVEPALRDFAQLIAALEAQLPPIPQ